MVGEDLPNALRPFNGVHSRCLPPARRHYDYSVPFITIVPLGKTTGPRKYHMSFLFLYQSAMFLRLRQEIFLCQAGPYSEQTYE